MFNLLAGMNPEKLLNSFVMGMKPEKKAEVIAKFDEGLTLARKTSEDFEIIKQQNVIIMAMLDSLIASTNTIDQTTISTESEVIAIADTVETIADESPEGKEG